MVHEVVEEVVFCRFERLQKAKCNKKKHGILKFPFLILDSKTQFKLLTDN